MRGSRPKFSLGYGVPLAGGLLLAAALSVPTTNYTAATTAAPQILTGVLHTPAGAALSGARVSVSATQDKGTKSIETLIGTGIASSDGSFRVLGALRNAPRSYNPDGTIQLQVEVSAPGMERTYFVNAKPPAPGSTAWTWGDVADDDVLDAGAIPGTSLATSALDTGNLGQAEAHKPLAGIDLTTTPVSTSAQTIKVGTQTVRLAASTVPSNCSNSWWATEASKYDQIRNVAVQHIATENRTTQDYKWYSTKSTELGIVVDEDISTSGGKVGGGMSYEKGSEKTSSTHPTYGSSFWNGHFNTSWRYKRQQFFCTYRNQFGEYRTVATSKHRYVPWNWTLGNGSVKDSHGFTCRSTARSQYAVSVATGTWQKLSGYFTVWGVKVTASQKATTGNELTMHKRKAYKYYYICGNASSDPGSSSAIWEQYRS